MVKASTVSNFRILVIKTLGVGQCGATGILLFLAWLHKYICYSFAMDMKKIWKQILLSSALFGLIDQVTKSLVVNGLRSTENQTYKIIGNFFKLEYTENQGIAFGFNLPAPQLVFSILTLLLMIFIIYLAIRELNLNLKLSQFAIALILGGALGNLIDRVTQGFVVDFIAIWKWPNFNLADSFIVIGVLLLVIFYGKIKHVNGSVKLKR